MTTARAAIGVGIFVVVSLVLIIVGVAWTTRGIGSGDDTYRLVAVFDDVSGLADGTKVTVAGFTVGRVEDMKLDGSVVKVGIRVRKSVVTWTGELDQEGIRKNGAALHRLQASMLGDYYLELSPGVAGTKLKEGDRIPTVVTATALQQTIDKLQTAGDIIPKIDKIAGDVAKVTDKASKVFGSAEGEAKFEEIGNNLVNASKDLSETVAALRARLSSGVFANGGDLDRGLRAFANTTEELHALVAKADHILDRGGNSAMRSLDHVEVVARNIRELVGDSKDDVHSTVGTFKSTLEQLREGIQKATLIMTDLGGAAKNVNQVTQDIADGKGNVGRLLKDDTVIKNVESITTDAKDLIHRYQALETGIDYRLAAYAFRQQDPARLSWQSHLTLRLGLAEDKAVLITLSGNNLGKTHTYTRLTSTTVNGTAGSTAQPSLTETFRENDSSWTLGLQYMRRFGPLSLRGGLIESTAGGGADLWLFKDRVVASFDLFRFTDDVRPRLRAGISWRFVPWAYAWVGGDELLFPTTRMDLYYGLGLAFTDNDLKMLFVASPSVSR